MRTTLLSTVAVFLVLLAVACSDKSTAGEQIGMDTTTAPATSAPSSTAPSTTAPSSTALSTTSSVNRLTETTTPTTSTTASTPTSTATGEAEQPESSTTVLTYPSTGLVPGDRGADVTQLQEALESLGFRTGNSIDGIYGPGTSSAVLAFQKYQRLDRTGVADPNTLISLASVETIAPPLGSAGPTIDIDLERQIIFATTETGERKILSTSTGNGELYRSANGQLVTATTPTGQFRIERRIDGVRRSYLGSLYRPLYFKRGWAIHGSNSVPAYPASHGCVRVRNNDQDWLFGNFDNGTAVNVQKSLAHVGSVRDQ